VIKTILSVSLSIEPCYSLFLNCHFTDRGLITVLVTVQGQSQIGRRVKGVVDLEFVLEFSIPIIFDDRKMQMYANRVIWIAGIIPLIAEESACFDQFLSCTSGEFIGDVGIPELVRHVGVIEPDLPAGLKRVAWHSDDDRGL